MRKAELIESKRHGTLDFPIEYYFVDSESLRYTMPMHWHREFEIIRVFEGRFVAFFDNVEYNLKKGDIALVECGCLHRGEPDKCVYECVVFDVDMLKGLPNSALEKYITSISESEVEIERVLPSESVAYSAANRLFDTMNKKQKFYELDVYSCLFEMFFGLLQSGQITHNKKSLPNRQTKALMNLISWMGKHFTEQISLERLSEISGFNQKYLCRVFREYTSKTVVEYLNELRIENACLEMSVKNKTTTEAAYDSGFNDLSYFCKVFKRYVGITPGEYKRSKK